MNQTQPIDFYGALFRILEKRQGFDAEAVTGFASAYNLKRQFALQAGLSIIGNYAAVIKTRHVLKRPFYDPEEFDFFDPLVQLAYWVDSLLHNCRGALETLGHIVNFVYRLGLRERDVTFVRSLEASETAAVGVHKILRSIYDDAWFTIVNRLRNRSYHGVVNTFVPKVRYGTPALRYTIRFPIDPTQGNLTHRTLDDFLDAGYTFKMASMELAEFSNFIVVRLEEYLSQIDAVIMGDCSDISEDRPPRSESTRPELRIPWMELRSWRNLIDVRDQPFGQIETDGDLE
jgi:hypothetical protein